MNLGHNDIECLENLNHMNLKTLQLDHNKIYKYEEGDNVGLKTLEDLRYIDLSYNELKTLELLKGVTSLQEIRVEANNIGNPIELTHLRDMRYLTKASFVNNPVTSSYFYTRVCLDCMRHVCILDGKFVDAAEKVRKLKLRSQPQN